MHKGRGLRTRFLGNKDLGAKYQRLGLVFVGQTIDRMKKDGRSYAFASKKLPNGVTINVIHTGGVPVLEIFAPAKPTPEPPIIVPSLFGFVTKPRKLGEPFDPFPIDITNGENFYGQTAHVLIKDAARGEEFPEWGVQYFDDTNVEDATYYEEVFPIGLVNHGNVDWRDGTEKLTVTWIGPPARSLGSYDYLAGYVFHNGRLLLDLWNPPDGDEGGPIDENRTISCACLKLIGTDLWLYWLAVPFESAEGDARLCRALLRPHPDYTAWTLDSAYLCPQLDQVQSADVEELHTITVDLGDCDVFGWGVGAFNQAATETRVLYHIYDVTGDLFREKMVEIAVDFSDLDAIEETQTTYEVYVQDETTHGTYTWGANATAYTTIEWTDPTPGGPPAAPGIEIQPMDVQEAVGIGFALPNSGANPILVYMKAGSVSRTLTVVGEAMPMAIDFRDNVPVRLWWAPCAASGTSTYEAEWVNTDVRSGERTNDYDGISETIIAEHNEHDTSYSFSSDASSASSLTGGRLYVQVEGEPTPRLDLEFSATRSDASSTLCTGEAHHVGDMDASMVWTLSNEASVSITASLSASYESVRHQLWWLDMRYDSWVVLTEEYEYNYTGSRADSGTQDHAGSTYAYSISLSQNNSAPPFVENVAHTSSVTGTSGATVTLSVVMYGEEVYTDELTSSLPVSYAPSGTYTARVVADINVAPQTSGVLTAGVVVDGGGLGSIGMSFAGSGNAAASQALRELILGDPPVPAQVFNETTTNPVEGTQELFGEYIENFDITAHIATLWPIFDPTLTLFGQSWMLRGADTDTRTQVNLALPKAFGTWIAYRGRWAYSMPWPEQADMTVPRWLTQFQPEDPERATEEIIGFAADAELYATMWPLSLCITSIPPNFTEDDLKDL